MLKYPKNILKQVLITLILGNVLLMSIHIGIVAHQHSIELDHAKQLKQKLENFLINDELDLGQLEEWLKSSIRHGFDFYIFNPNNKPIFYSSGYKLSQSEYSFDKDFHRFEHTLTFKLNSRYLALIQFDRPPSPISKYPWELKLDDIKRAGYLTFSLIFIFANLLLVAALFVFRWISHRVVNQKAAEVNQTFEAIISGKSVKKISKVGVPEVDKLIDNFDKLMERTEEKISRLEEARCQLNQKVHELSHDFKTPLTSINQVAQNTKTYFNQLSQEDIQKNMGVVIAEVSFISRMVENMLFLTQMSSDAENQVNKRLSLSDILNRELDNFQCLDKEISASIAEDQHILGNDLYVSRLIKNLLNNACKYGDKLINIRLEMRGDQCTLIIENDGQQIEDKTNFGKHKLTRKISSLDGIYISMGLGSVIIRQIVNMLQGEILVSNRKEGGTVIQIDIPVV